MIVDFDKLVTGAIHQIHIGFDVLPEKPLLYPGSFNPMHKGHSGLLRAAEQLSGRPGCFELSVRNVDKPSLTLEEVERRLAGVSAPLVLTNAPTFIEKARRFPKAWFALGYDTAVRLLDPKYHADVPAMLHGFQTLETRFMVAGRLHGGRFQSLEHIDIPEGFEDLFLPLPEALFREDVSSTELRST